VHGDADDIVPIEQSERMKKALDKAGHPTELISFEGEGHPVFSDEHERLMLGAIDRFLWQRLGAGFGVTTPPVPPPKH
jgi:dipeptidyl aminopeptidase/acylaminoacyl peptidase